MDTADFWYELPDEAIAQTAIEPRHAARLLVVPELDDRRFSDLPQLLAPGDLLVVNRTRVRAARLRGRKETGGAVEALLTKRLDVERWQALIRPARRIRVGTRLDFDRIDGVVLSEPQDGVVTLGLRARVGDVDDHLPEIGELPLPPYFHGSLSDEDRYQTMFAKSVGSAAAPTAGLHFTPPVIEALRARGVEVTEVELDVGLDTFRPISAERIEDHVMHREAFRVPAAAADAIGATRSRGGAVVAVGTTVVRTLETAAEPDGVVGATEGTSGLFITPGYRFRVVDRLLTNFHAPGTTLIVLLAAFAGAGWRRAYEHALRQGYRFLSFGDAMLVSPDPSAR